MVAASAEAKCPMGQVEVRGQVVEVDGGPIEGAGVRVFLDEDPTAVLEQDSSEDAWRTDSEGRFVARVAFLDAPRPRWWHRFRLSGDRCGRDPDSFLLDVRATSYRPRQLVIRVSDERVRQVEQGWFVVELDEPLELLPE